MPKSEDILDLNISSSYKYEKPIRYVNYDAITQEYFNEVIKAVSINKFIMSGAPSNPKSP